MIDKQLLSILACPETKKNLVLADDKIIAKVNAAIAQGNVRNRSKEKISDKIDGGLFREGDNKSLYPIKNGIPILLVEELMDISQLAS